MGQGAAARGPYQGPGPCGVACGQRGRGPRATALRGVAGAGERYSRTEKRKFGARSSGDVIPGAEARGVWREPCEVGPRIPGFPKLGVGQRHEIGRGAGDGLGEAGDFGAVGGVDRVGFGVAGLADQVH